MGQPNTFQERLEALVVRRMVSLQHAGVANALGRHFALAAVYIDNDVSARGGASATSCTAGLGGGLAVLDSRGLEAMRWRLKNGRR
jgi:hypothetical protein